MTHYLDEASLPPDLQGAQTWLHTRPKASVSWIDPAKLPPLPVDGAWIDAEMALRILHNPEHFREALKRHSEPQALDHFVAEFCRQVPPAAHHPYYIDWQRIAADLGRRETADVLAQAMIHKLAVPMFVLNAAHALAKIGDHTNLPAIALAIMRTSVDYFRDHLQGRFDEIARRAKLTPAEVEDWSVPDDPDADESAALVSPQSARLERAMRGGRRWTVKTFDLRIAHQPLMVPLAAGLVWGYFDDTGRLLVPFVIDSGAQYPPAPEGATVGIVHPAHLSPNDRQHWRERVKDRVPPFSQWGVRAQFLSAEDTVGDRIAKLPAVRIPAARLLTRLESLGWRRPRTRTKLEFHTRPFADLGLIAVIRYTGIPLTYGGEWAEQSIVDCHFEANGETIPLARVSPIAISAILSDLEALA